MTTTPKDKKDNTKSSREHHVETPNPPQVMDPSAPPEDHETETSTPANAQNKEQKKRRKGDALTPNEEL